MVVTHLDHPLGAQRGERQVLARVPAADLGLPRRAHHALRPGPVPRVPLEGGDQGLHLGEQLPAPGHGERAHHAHAGQLVIGVQAEQQRADRLVAGLVRPVAGHHAVGGPLVLDLEHDPLVRLVPAVQRLGDQPVQPGALELGEPLPGQRPVGGGRRDVQRRAHPGEGLLQHGPALGERPLHVVGVPERQQVEGHEAGGSPGGQQVHPARRGVDPLQQCLEVEPGARGVGDHDLPVDHAPLRELLDDLADQLGKIPGHRAFVTAADLHLAAVAEDDGPESVPLWLVAVRAFGYLLDRLGEHRRDRRADRKCHRPILPFRSGHALTRPGPGLAAGPAGWRGARRAGTLQQSMLMPLHTDARRSGKPADIDINPLYVRLAREPVPRHALPRHSMLPDTALQVVRDELLLDGNARLNLATFVTPWVEPQAQQLMRECLAKNMIDKDEYPQTAALEARCVNILADLWHAPEGMNATGCSTTGSSEACMLAGMALLWRWRERRRAAKAAADRPNLVMGANVQVCWDKFCRYWQVEPRRVPMAPGRYHLTGPEAAARCDENTIGVVAVLGSTMDGSYEPVGEISQELDKLQAASGLDIPIHVDGASGGFVAAFLQPDLK